MNAKLTHLQTILGERFTSHESALVITQTLMRFKSHQIKLFWKILSVGQNYKFIIYFIQKGNKVHKIHEIVGNKEVIQMALVGCGIDLTL
jgi:hypothetical protein